MRTRLHLPPRRVKRAVGLAAPEQKFETVSLFEAAEVGHFAAAARRQLGELLGGDEGRGLVCQADAWMEGQTIKNPNRFVACLAPGFPDH